MDLFKGLKDFGESVAKGVSNVTNTVTDGIGQAWEGTKEVADTAWKGLKSGVGLLAEHIPIIGEEIKRNRIENEKWQNAQKQISVTEEEKKRADEMSKKFEEMNGAERAEGIGQGLGNMITGGIYTGYDYVRSLFTGEKNIGELKDGYSKEKDKIISELAKEANEKVKNGQMSYEDANTWLETKTREKLDEYILKEKGIDKLMFNNSELANLTETSPSRLFESSMGLRHSNEYFDTLNEVNKEIEEMFEKNNSFSIDQTDTILGNKVEFLKRWKEKAQENLADIKFLMYDQLAGVERGSKEWNDIYTGAALMQEAKLALAEVGYEKFKKLLIENPTANTSFLAEKANIEAIQSLSDTHKAVLKKEGNILSMMNYAGRISRVKADEKKLNESDSWGKKADIYKNIVINNLKIGADSLADSYGEVADSVFDIAIFNPLAQGKALGIDNAQDLKLFTDNYEYSMVDNGIGTSWLKHVVYNLDDIAETIVPLVISPMKGVGGGARGLGLLSSENKIGKLEQGAAKLSDTIKKAIGEDRVMKFSIGVSENPVISMPLSTINWATRKGKAIATDVAEGFLIQNPVIDRMTMQASNQENDVMNAIFDALGGRVWSGKGGISFGVNGQMKVKGNIGITVMDGIMNGKPFIETVEKISKENNIPIDQAASLLKIHKAQLGQLNKELVTGRDFYDNFQSVIKDLQESGMATTDWGNILRMDTPEMRYKRFAQKNNIENYFEAAMSGSEYDQKMVGYIHNKKLKEFKEAIDGKYEVSGLKMTGFTEQEVKRYKEVIDGYQKQLDIAIKSGDTDAMLDIYNKSDGFMQDIYKTRNREESMIELYNPTTKKKFKVPLNRIEELNINGSLKDLLNDGLVVEENILGITPGTYKVNIGDGQTQSSKLIRLEKKEGGIKYDFSGDLKDIREKFGDLGLKLDVIKTPKEKLPLEEVYQLYRDRDEWFGLGEWETMRYNKQTKKQEPHTVYYVLPGKKLLDKLLPSVTNPHEANYPLEIYNLAVKLGMNKSNIDEVMGIAIESYNLGHGNKEVSKIDFEQLYNHVLDNFRDETSLGKVLTEKGEEFKFILKGLYEHFKIDDGIDTYILKTLMLKLGRNEKTYESLKNMLLKQNKTLEDLGQINNVFFGDNTFRYLKHQMKNTFYMGNLEKELDEIIGFDIKTYKNEMEKLESVISDLEMNRDNVYGTKVGNYYQSKIDYYKGKYDIYKNKIELFEGNNFREKFLEHMYSTSLKNYIGRKTIKSFIHMDKNKVMGKKKIIDIPDEVIDDYIDLSEYFGRTPNELQDSFKYRKEKEDIENGLIDLSKELLDDVNGKNIDELVDEMKGKCDL